MANCYLPQIHKPYSTGDSQCFRVLLASMCDWWVSISNLTSLFAQRAKHLALQILIFVEKSDLIAILFHCLWGIEVHKYIFLDGLILPVLSIMFWQNWWKYFHGQAVTENFLWGDVFLVTPVESHIDFSPPPLLWLTWSLSVCQVCLLLPHKGIWEEESQDTSPIVVMWI